jgi:hypothetical protein
LSFAIFLQTAVLPEMQSLVIFAGCALFTLALALYIFIPAPVEGGEEKTRLAYLYERKEVIYENLRDLNFEHKAGKLGETDYQGLSNSMEEEAAAVLAEIDQLENGAGAPASLARKDKVRL